MKTFCVLLRAVNVGGTGKLPMRELVALCGALGFSDVKTYIQSGNVVLQSNSSEASVKAKLEKGLAAKLGKPVGVLVRTPAAMDRVLADNPFTEAPPSRVLVMFYDDVLDETALDDVVAPGGEELSLHGREIYVHYPNGQGRSKLKIPLVKQATGRNINTVTKLAAMARHD